MMGEKIGVLASGRGSNFEAILEHVEMDILQGVDVEILLSDNPDARALEVADNYEVSNQVFEPKEDEDREEYDRRLNEVLEDHGVSLVILAGFMRIVSPYLIDKYRGRIMNIHPALLPSFKGLNAQKQTLEYGAKVSGCTVHYAAEDVDAGPIILQHPVPVKEGDTEESLSKRILVFEHRLYSKAIQLHADERLEIENGNVKIDYSNDWKKKWDQRQKKFIEYQKEAWKNSKIFEEVWE